VTSLGVDEPGTL